MGWLKCVRDFQQIPDAATRMGDTYRITWGLCSRVIQREWKRTWNTSSYSGFRLTGASGEVGGVKIGTSREDYIGKTDCISTGTCYSLGFSYGLGSQDYDWASCGAHLRSLSATWQCLCALRLAY